MSGLSQHQNVFRISKPDHVNGTQKAKITRNRASASCSACRARKSKCDRQSPCSSCSKRGDGDSCNYMGAGRKASDRDVKGPSKSDEARLRLRKLEEMVMALMPTPPVDDHSSPLPATSVQRTSACSEPTLGDRALPSEPRGLETDYAGVTHWTTILSDIKDIQGSLTTDHENSDSESISSPSFDSPDILLGHNPPLTLNDVLSCLPPRPTVDKILSAFFNAGHIQVIPLIHSKQFTREYDLFWRQPSSASFLWISMLFSILSLGAHASQASGQSILQDADGSVKARFRNVAGRALITGQYQKAGKYSVESTLLYAVCKYAQKQDPDSEVWMIMGTAVRLALKMGYHRDPRHLARISPFESEMRRRTFLLVDTFDLILSFQAGLPATIHEVVCDVEPPRNLLDSDFDEDCTSLPSSRPLTDPTPMLYIITKGQLGKILRRVHRRELSFGERCYEDTMMLDKELRQSHFNIPPSLRRQPLGSSFTDPTYMWLMRLNLEIIYLQVLCVLHRRYLTHEKSNPLYEYSRETCVDAALQVLDILVELHASSQPGAQLSEDRWMLTSIALQVFLLAAMITCVDLYERSKASTMSIQDTQIQVKKYNAVRLSYDILLSRRAASKEACRVTNILQILLSKVSVPTSHAGHTDLRLNTLKEGGVQCSSKPSLGSEPTSSQEFIDDFVSHDMSQLDLVFDNEAMQGSAMMTPLSNVFEELTDIDWGLMDQYLLGQNDNDNFGLGF